jgi:60 kDa SS-A/Ro ribonucleoprotein
MLYAMSENLPVEAFVILTDNETWAGKIHPSQALIEYRRKSGIDARMVAVGMTATEYSVADPNDTGSLNVVGMDTATPNLISGFIRGEF